MRVYLELRQIIQATQYTPDIVLHLFGQRTKYRGGVTAPGAKELGNPWQNDHLSTRMYDKSRRSLEPKLIKHGHVSDHQIVFMGLLNLLGSAVRHSAEKHLCLRILRPAAYKKRSRIRRPSHLGRRLREKSGNHVVGVWGAQYPIRGCHSLTRRLRHPATSAYLGQCQSARSVFPATQRFLQVQQCQTHHRPLAETARRDRSSRAASLVVPSYSPLRFFKRYAHLSAIHNDSGVFVFDVANRP